MAATAINRVPDVTIDLDDPNPPASHRLAELVQVLTGCRAAEAELAVEGRPGAVDPDAALERVAAAMVRIRRARGAAPDQGLGDGPAAPHDATAGDTPA